MRRSLDTQRLMHSGAWLAIPAGLGRVLAEVLGRYTEGDDIPPVVEARHLLAAG